MRLVATTPHSNANYALKYSLSLPVSRTFFGLFGLFIRLTLRYFCQMNLNSNRYNADSVTLEIGIILLCAHSKMMMHNLFNCVFAFAVFSSFIFDLTQFPIRKLPNSSFIPHTNPLFVPTIHTNWRRAQTNPFKIEKCVICVYF